jgi:hypothetical protein
MAKDSHGHGSDAHGGAVGAAHQAGVRAATTGMQRRQYEAIAGTINNFGGGSDVKSALAAHFAGALQGTNPHFDAGKFQTAATTGNMGRTQGKQADMQARHYSAVANAVHSFGTSHPAVKDALVSHFSDELGRRNSNFNADRFKKAAS